MAGTPKPGRISTLEIEQSPGSGTYTQIGGCQELKLAISQHDIDVTDKDSAGYEEGIPGNTGLVISGTMNYEEDDAGQIKFITCLLNKEVRSFRWRPWGTNVGHDQWICNGFPTSQEINSPNKEALSFPFSVKLTGTPTHSTQ